MQMKEEIVCAASDDNTVGFVCQIKNYLSLDPPKVVLYAHSVLIPGGEGIDQRIGVSKSLFLRPDKRFCHTAFSGGQLDDVRVIVWNIQFFGKLFSDSATAASELTADRDDFVFHINLLLL